MNQHHCQITQLITYPIKSCGGIQHQSIELNALGLIGDRQWMLVDDQGVFISQRKYPNMALIQPEILANSLSVIAPGMEPLKIDLAATQHPIEITVWKDTFQAQPFDQTVNQWFSDYLGIAVKLVQHTAVSHRLIDQDYARPDQYVAFADGYPILVAHEASLEQLNQALSDSVNISRFRPNIVVASDLQAWDELNWRLLLSEKVQLNLIKPCTRCVMTGVEQTSGQQTGTEVLKTLRHSFSHQDKAVFGMNAIPTFESATSGVLKLGSQLQIQ